MKKNTILILLTVLSSFSFNAQTKEDKVKLLFELTGDAKPFENYIMQSVKNYQMENPSAPETYWAQLEEEALEYGMDNLIKIITPTIYTVYSDKEMDRMIKMLQKDKEKLLSQRRYELSAKLENLLFDWFTSFDKKIESTVNAGAILDYTLESIHLKDSELKLVSHTPLKIINTEDLVLDTEHNPGSYILDFGDVTGKQNVQKYIELKNVSDEEIALSEPFYLDDKFDVEYEHNVVPPNETVKIYITCISAIINGTNYHYISIPTGSSKMISFGVQAKGTDLRKMSIDFKQKALKVDSFETDYSDSIEFHFTNTGEMAIKVLSVEIDHDAALVNYSKDWIPPNESGHVFIVYAASLMKKEEMGDLSAKLKVSFKKDNGSDYYNRANEIIELVIFND